MVGRRVVHLGDQTEGHWADQMGVPTEVRMGVHLEDRAVALKVDRSVGHLVGRTVALKVDRSVDHWADRMVGHLEVRMVVLTEVQMVDHLEGWLEFLQQQILILQ